MAMTTDQAQKLETHDELLLGRNGEPGVVHKVGFMWRIQIWLIGIIGMFAGAAITKGVEFLDKMSK